MSDTFYTKLDYPDVGSAVSFLAERDPEDAGLWHGIYELTYRSSRVYGDGTPDFELARRDIRVPRGHAPEHYLAEACADGGEPGIPPEAFGKWSMDADLCDLAEEFDAKAMTLREMLAEFEGGQLAGSYDEYAAFAKANRWAFRYDDE